MRTGRCVQLSNKGQQFLEVAAQAVVLSDNQDVVRAHLILEPMQLLLVCEGYATGEGNSEHPVIFGQGVLQPVLKLL